MTPKIELIHGDCFKELANIDKNEIDLVITDPPYFIDKYDDKWEVSGAKESDLISGIPAGMRFDPKDGIRLEHFTTEFAKLLIETMKPGAFALVFSQPRLVHRMMTGLENAGFEIRDLYCWYYMNSAQFKAFSMDHFIDKMHLSDARKETIKDEMKDFKTAQLRPQFESLVLAQKSKESTHVDNWLKYQTGLMNLSRFQEKVPTTVMPFKKDKRDVFNDHPTVKPVAMLEHLIKLFSIEGQKVLDPFVGSGTTLLAAKHTLRDCKGIEKKNEYVEIAKQRLANDNLLFNFA